MKTVLTVTFAAVLAFAGACSSDDDSGGGSSSALPPVIVDTADDVTLTVGEFIDITTLEADKATSSDPSVLGATDAYSDGSAEFNAGAEAKGVGTAVLSVYDGDSILYEVNVTVTK